jgi:pilus assembly protein CpaF
LGIQIEIKGLKAGVTSVESPRVFDKSEILVGRKAENDLVLADSQVSGKHLKISLIGEELEIEDLGSSNGTFMEDVKLNPKESRKIPSGSKILVGSYLLIVTALSVKKEAAPVKEASASTPEAPVSSKTPKDVLKLKGTIREQLIERLDLRRKDILAITEGDLRQRAERVVGEILVDLRWEIPQGLNRTRLIKEILDEALLLGPLEELLNNDDVSEVMVNRFDQIYAEAKGQLSLTDYKFTSEGAVLAIIERILAPIGRRIDESSPMVDARLKDGSRVNAVIRPLALNGPCITIRKFPKHALTVDSLVKYNSLTDAMGEFLKLAVENRLNVVISGGTGSGKTTLLNVVSSFIPDEQRVITVEDAAELKLRQEHVISFETRPPNLEGKGAITIRDLVRNALRMRPDRIIVGECRGGEALDMLQAMNTGHDGSMTTGHANTPADMLRRLETMVLTSGIDLPLRAIREQIASAVHLIIQQTRFACGTRKVTAITEVLGLDQDEGTVILQDVFLFKQDGYGPEGKVRGKFQATGYVPMFFRKLQERGLSVSASVFAPGDIA